MNRRATERVRLHRRSSDTETKRNFKNFFRLTRLPTQEYFVVRKGKFGNLYNQLLLC